MDSSAVRDAVAGTTDAFSDLIVLPCALDAGTNRLCVDLFLST